MVCLGNICRSPIAEVVMQKLIREQGLNWKVDSAGTNRYHKGGPADPRSVAICKTHGLDLSNHVARRFEPSDFKKYDVIYSLADDVTAEIRSFARTSDDMKNVRGFLDALHPEQLGRSVPDPWYGGDDGFEECYQLVERACRAILKR